MVDGIDDTLRVPGLDATLVSEPRAALGPTSIERGSIIGRYVVLSKLGAGAMGVVVAAYDPELDRKVALKLLKVRGEDQAGAATRLQREAQALAKLDHRNVVAVHDVGLHAGQLFVGMEYVEGQTLGEWMASAETVHPWPKVVRVFMDAGRGLAAAHEAGLIHRDFKPDNVMLGDDGRVRVMDFGLARAEGDELPLQESVLQRAKVPTGKQLLASPLTQTGTLMGTPAYMSLEQFEGRPADARSDQFGFCVALYEALYGERPFAGDTAMSLLHNLSTGQIRPAAKGVAVPTWLRKVVVRGLATAPGDRWPSMQALLGALADDPRIRRRKWWSATLLVGLVGLGGWGLVHATRQDARTCKDMDDRLAGVWDENRRLQVEAAFEDTNLNYAMATWERVEQRLDDYTRGWVEARTEACEATHRGEQSERLLDLRMACLDERLLHVRALVDVLANADSTSVEHAVQAVAGLPSLDRCQDVDALTAEIPPPDDPEVAERVATLEEQLIKAKALQTAGKYVEGLAALDAMMTEVEELDYGPLQARVWLAKGTLHDKDGEYATAEPILERSLEAALANEMATEAAAATAELIFITGRLARYEDARRWAKIAKPLAQAAGGSAEGPYLGAIASIAKEQGNFEDARRHLEEALSVLLETRGPDDPVIATVYDHLGGVFKEEAKLAEANDYYSRSLELRQELLGPDHPFVGTSLNNLGTVAQAWGKLEEAQADYERALSVWEGALGPKHPHLAACLNNLGNVTWDQGDHETARRYVRRALKIWEESLGPDHPKVGVVLSNLGTMTKDDLEKSRGYHERALAIMEKAWGPEHPQLIAPLINLGAIAHDENENAAARGYFERALDLALTSLGPDHPNVGYALHNLGSVTQSEGAQEQAKDYYLRALGVWEKALGPTHVLLAHPLTGLGDVALELGKPIEALELLERALTLRTSGVAEATELAETRFRLARALWDAPAKRGRDRARATLLAEQARDAYAEVDSSEDREEVEVWLASHTE